MSEDLLAAGDPAPRFRLLRSADQLELRVAIESATVRERVGGGVEVAADVVTNGIQRHGRLTIAFPPQHLVEYDHGTQQRPIFGDGTVVAFRLPFGSVLPMTVTGLLAALPSLGLAPNSLGDQPAPEPTVPAVPAVEVLAATAARADAARAARRAAAAPMATDRPSVAPAAADRVGSGDPHPGPDPGAGPDPVGRDLTAPDLARADRARRAALRMPEQQLVVVPDPVAGGPTGSPSEPAQANGKTVLRFPSRVELITRPGATRLAAAVQPAEHAGRVELWHARFAARRSDGKLVEVPLAIRAERTRELPPPPAPPGNDKPWRDLVDDGAIGGAVTELDRKALVTQTATASGVASAEQLWLSPWGAWLDASGEWPSGALLAWEQKLGMGRDLKARTVSKGTLYPLGHQAIRVSFTERKLDPKVNGRAAGLVTKTVLIVTQREKAYDAHGDAVERGWPWRRVKLVTTRTPDVQLQTFPPGADSAHAGLLPQAGGVSFEWDCVGVDRGGRVSTFALPLVFVPDGVLLDRIEQHYGAVANDALRTVELRGQVLSVAPTDGAEPDSADVLVSSLRLGLPSRLVDGATVKDRPVVEQLVGRLPSFERFTRDPAELTMSFAGPYLNSAFGSGNVGEALLALTGPGPVLELAEAATTGGLFSPSYALTGLSRRLGPVGGQLSELAKGQFSIRDLLGPVLDQVKLFGVFALTDLLGPDVVQGLEKAPELVSRTLDGVSHPSFRWELDLFTSPDGVSFGSTAVLRPRKGGAGATLSVTIDTTVLDGTTVTMRQHTVAKVTDVELQLSFAGQDLLVVPLKELRFDSVDAQKPDVDVRLGELEFLGILSFVKALAGLIPADGFSDPPALDVRPDGVTSSFSVPVPDVAVGVFSLENLAIHSSLELFFSGAAPAFELNFARRDSPFRVTVAAMGGGGHVGLRVAADGLQWLDGRLEFGAALAISLGPVARGSVSAMGGVSFLIDANGDATLTAYLDLRGELRVLGLISVSLQLLLALAYESASGKLVGRAELVFKVKVLFFKKTVRVGFERKFAGSNADPTFAELMPATGTAGQRPWDSYCTAYAEV